MKKFDDYEFQIEWIENIESIDEDDKKRLYELRTLNKRRKTHLNYLKKNQKIYDEYKRREKLVKEIEKKEKEVFDDVSLLKKVIIPKISVYKKDESSKSLKDQINHYKRKTYKGEPLQRRYVWYCTVRMRTLTKFQKNIYLGSSEKVERVLNWYNDVKTFSRTDNQIKNQITMMLMDFFKPNLKDGWETFSQKSLSLEKVIYPFLKELKKNQK